MIPGGQQHHFRERRPSPPFLWPIHPSPLHQLQLGEWDLGSTELPQWDPGKNPGPWYFGIFWGKEMCLIETIFVFFCWNQMSLQSFWTKVDVSSDYTLCEWTCWYSGGTAQAWGQDMTGAAAPEPLSYMPVFKSKCSCLQQYLRYWKSSRHQYWLLGNAVIENGV